jgi:hypothetical protein
MKIRRFLVLVLVGIFSVGVDPSTFGSDQDSSVASVLGPEDFYNWSLDRQIVTATVIARADWKVEGNIRKCIIAELIKQDAGVNFQYKVGDEFARGNQRIQPDTNYGEGQVLFFTDSPPVLRHISVIAGGRLIGLKDVPLEKIREMVSRKGS